MKKLILENLFKNIIIAIALIICYQPIFNALHNNPSLSDKSIDGSLLIAIQILSVTACFGAFAFTYEKMDAKKSWLRLISHITTGLLIFIIGISFEISSVIINSLVVNFQFLDLTWLLLYIAVVFYDFWDLARTKLN